MSAVGVGISSIAALLTRMSIRPPAAAVACSARRRTSVFPGADIGGNELGAAACGPDAGDDGIAALLIATADDDERSFVGQRRRDGHPEAACRTGDKCCAAS